MPLTTGELGEFSNPNKYPGNDLLMQKSDKLKNTYLKKKLIKFELLNSNTYIH